MTVLTGSLYVGHIVLLSFDVRLDVGRRQQPYGMAKCLQLADQWCDEAEASMPTGQGCGFSKNART